MRERERWKKKGEGRRGGGCEMRERRRGGREEDGGT